MSRVQWDAPGATVASIKVARPRPGGNYLFLGPIVTVTTHWLETPGKTVPHVEPNCPHCAFGLPPMRQGYAPVAVHIPAPQLFETGVWHRLCLQVAPTLVDRLVMLGTYERRVINVRIEAAGKFRRYKATWAEHLQAAAPKLDTFDVRPIVEAHWGLAPAAAAGDDVATDEPRPGVLPFRRAAAG